MSPIGVSSGLTAFQAAVSAAQPIRQAPALQVAALIEQGASLVASVDAALGISAVALDEISPSGAPTQMIATLLAAVDAGDDASRLCDLRGYLGRAVLNLSQAQA